MNEDKNKDVGILDEDDNAWWLIYSIEHSAYWKINGYGYTQDIKEAGRFNVFEAERICEDANKYVSDGILKEIITPSPESLLAEKAMIKMPND